MTNNLKRIVEPGNRIRSVRDYPTLEDLIRIFADRPEGQVWKDYREGDDLTPASFTTKNGLKGLERLKKFVVGIARLSCGGDTCCRNLTVDQILDALDKIAIHGEWPL